MKSTCKLRSKSAEILDRKIKAYSNNNLRSIRDCMLSIFMQSYKKFPFKAQAENLV